MKRNAENRPLAERLGFHRDTILPEVPEGMALVKFHGEPAVIPGQKDGDVLFGKTPFTEVQIEALQQLELHRVEAIKLLPLKSEATIYES